MLEGTLLTVLGAILVGVLSVGGVALSNISGRLDNVEEDLRRSRNYNHKLWAYCRKHLDMYYKWRKDGAPDPEPIPEELEQ